MSWGFSAVNMTNARLMKDNKSESREAWCSRVENSTSSSEGCWQNTHFQASRAMVSKPTPTVTHLLQQGTPPIVPLPGPSIHKPSQQPWTHTVYHRHQSVPAGVCPHFPRHNAHQRISVPTECQPEGCRIFWAFESETMMLSMNKHVYPHINCHWFCVTFGCYVGLFHFFHIMVEFLC